MTAGLLDEVGEKVASSNPTSSFSQMEWQTVAQKTFPRTLTSLLNGSPVVLPKKLAGMDITRRPGGLRFDTSPYQETSVAQGLPSCVEKV